MSYSPDYAKTCFVCNFWLVSFMQGRYKQQTPLCSAPHTSAATSSVRQCRDSLSLSVPRLPQSVSAATPSVCQCRDSLSLSVPRLPQSVSAATASVCQCRDCLSLSVTRLPQSASDATPSVCQSRDSLSLPEPRLPQSVRAATPSVCLCRESFSLPLFLWRPDWLGISVFELVGRRRHRHYIICRIQVNGPGYERYRAPNRGAFT